MTDKNDFITLVEFVNDNYNEPTKQEKTQMFEMLEQMINESED